MSVAGGSVEEQVQLYDERGTRAGTTARSRMRRENLVHAATAVVVLDPEGRVYVHRRTDTKDVYPGRFDFVAGGVLNAGEDPDAAALRELREELGIEGAALTPLGRTYYGDANTRFWAYRYVTTWDGPVRWQPEEVAWGDWWPLDRLVAALNDPDWPVMPDTAEILGDWLRTTGGAND